MFGFSMSGFFSQVKKSLWDPAPNQLENDEDDEDNGEISPDSCDPEPEETAFGHLIRRNNSNEPEYVHDQSESEGVTMVGAKYQINQKKTNTRIASPGAQLENSNQQYLKSHTYESRSLSKDREKVEKLETKNFVSPRQIPSWTALGGAISDKL